MVDINGLQLYTLDEILDERYGVRGTTERERFEREVKLDGEHRAKARERSKQWRAKKRAEKEAQACTEACTDSCRGSLPANPEGSPKANPYNPAWTPWPQQPTIVNC